MNAREYVHYSRSIVGGPATEEELAAARACGHINAYMQEIDEVLDTHSANLPEGWRLSRGDWSHDWHLPAPEIPTAASEPILMGFIRIRQSDPHFPVWLWKAR